MESITHFARRKKLVTGLVTGALIGTMGVLLAYWGSTRRSEKPVAAARPVPKDIQQQVSGYTFTRSEEGRQVFTIHAARTVAFKAGGTTVLEDVYVEVFGKDGHRRDLLRTRRCDYNTQSGDLFSSGTVEIELNAAPLGKPPAPVRSLRLETSRLHFRQQGARVASDEAVRFRIGPVSGSARGLNYAVKDEWLELRSEVKAELESGGQGQPPLQLTAARARFDKRNGEVRLSGPVTVRRESSRADAAHATIFLDARNRVTRAVFEGPVRATHRFDRAQVSAWAGKLVAEFEPESEALRRAIAEENAEVESRREGSVSGLRAQKVEVVFAGQPSRAQSGTASGGVRISQETATEARLSPPQVGPAGRMLASRKELSAEVVQFNFRPGPLSLKDAATVGAGKLVLVSGDPRAGERIVTAGQLRMSFDSRNRLEMVRGDGGTRITFPPLKNAPPRSPPPESTAERLVAVLDPTTQGLRTLEQTGDFRFWEGDRQATAERATYQTSSETLTLIGHPQLWDTEMRGRAEKILIDLARDAAEGVGKVESTHFCAAGCGEPTNVLADRVVAERRSQMVHYEGHVRAWRGADVLESATLEVFRSERRVSSGTQVLTSHLQPAALVGSVQGKNGQRLTRPVMIRAEQLEYFDQGRRASYRGQVRLQTENTILESEQLDAYFTRPGGGQEMALERAVAEGDVKVTQPGRRATGRHAEYFAGDARIVLRGGPPSVYDAERGFTSGRSLTFYSRDGRVIVSGGDESPTVSRHRIEQ